MARVAGISRRAIYRPINHRPEAAGPGEGRPGDEAIVEVAKANSTDGTRMVAAIATGELGAPVNRERAQRVMRAHRMLQLTRGNDHRRRSGFFRVTRPNELWHMDMTTVWTATHGWVYVHVIVDDRRVWRSAYQSGNINTNNNRRQVRPLQAIAPGPVQSHHSQSCRRSSRLAPITPRSSLQETSVGTCPRAASPIAAAATGILSPKPSSSPGSGSSRSAGAGAPNGRPSTR